MAKSIRSKCKRKARAEFRRTIGTEFRKKKQAEIQDKLKECAEAGSMKSLDKIANLLETNNTPEPENDNTMDGGVVDAVEAAPVVDDLKGENKAPVKKGKRSRKHSLKAAQKKEKEEKRKHRPKYFVQF